MTFQRRGKATIAREKPIPRDPYSLAQAYQRWDYKDYAYLWTLETEASKQSYRTRASRYHITGYSLWMKEHLRDLPDLAGRWHLDERGGATVFDSSKNANNGTIIGATPTTGLIDGAFYFDGLNDTMRILDHPSITPTTGDFTAECYFKHNNPATWARLISKQSVPSQWIIRLDPNKKMAWFIQDTDGTSSFLSGSVVPPDEWHYAAFTRKNHDFTLWLDENIDIFLNDPAIGNLDTTGADLYIGSFQNASEWFKGTLDNPAMWLGAFDPTTIRRHSLRRYSL